MLLAVPKHGFRLSTTEVDALSGHSRGRNITICRITWKSTYWTEPNVNAPDVRGMPGLLELRFQPEAGCIIVPFERVAVYRYVMPTKEENLVRNPWLILMLVASLVLLPACNDVTLQASAVDYHGTFSSRVYGAPWVRIRNEGASDWTNVIVAVNTGDYQLEVSSIGAGDQVEVRWSDFTNKDGSRLEYTKLKPKSLTITAVVDGRRARWSGPVQDNGDL